MTATAAAEERVRAIRARAELADVALVVGLHFFVVDLVGTTTTACRGETAERRFLQTDFFVTEVELTIRSEHEKVARIRWTAV